MFWFDIIIDPGWEPKPQYWHASRNWNFIEKFFPSWLRYYKVEYADREKSE